MQKGLFDELPKEDQPKKQFGLLHLAVAPRKQNEINKKIEKIKKLKLTFEKTKSTIHSLKDTYDELILPSEDVLINHKEDFIIKLHQRWSEKGFTNWQKDVMEGVILDELKYIRDFRDSSNVLNDIEKEIITAQQDRMSNTEKDFLNDMARDFFEFSGIDLDEDFDFTDAGAFENFHRNQEQFKGQREEDDKRDKVLKTDKDFQKLYKRLVKKTHPDLVVEPAEKERREILMKELSNAWEARDYYKLLLLKSDIEVDDDAPISLAKDQTKILIKQLNKEIQDWEVKDYRLKRLDPETSFYYLNFYAIHQKTSLKKFEKFKEELEESLEIADLQLSFLKTKKSTKDFLKATYDNFEDGKDRFMDGW